LQYSKEQMEYKYFTVTVLHGDSSIPHACSRYRFLVVKGKFDMVLGK